MDVTLAVATTLGGALAGAVLGFLGALYVERRREKQHRLGLLVQLHTDLSRNAVRARGVIKQAAADKGGPLWDPSGPLSADIWEQASVAVASFIPFHLFMKLRTVYDELPFIAAFGERPEGAPDRAIAIQLVQRWVQLVEELQDEILGLPEARPIHRTYGNAWNFIRRRSAEAKALTAPQRSPVTKGDGEITTRDALIEDERIETATGWQVVEERKA